MISDWPLPLEENLAGTGPELVLLMEAKPVVGQEIRYYP